MAKRYENIPFKSYPDKQSILFPPNLADIIPLGHPVLIVDRVIDKVDIQSILDTFPSGGSSGYHPRIIHKVLIYDYLKNIYSSRQIEEALKENIHFMWISGKSRPDHNTITRFWGKRLDGNLKGIFGSVVEMLAGGALPKYKRSFILMAPRLKPMPTVIHFVWGKAIATQKTKDKAAAGTNMVTCPVNHNMERHKQEARNKLLNEQGVKRRGQRCADVKATFGLIKQNKGFRRYMLRGKEKVEIETGLIAIAHNFAKVSA